MLQRITIVRSPLWNAPILILNELRPLCLFPSAEVRSVRDLATHSWTQPRKILCI
uniref:Uncharacterized protein n=1 Tax=Rhizophora mucronata TaxID=61149 RepID=A0A2P2L9M3_RHIMU